VNTQYETHRTQRAVPPHCSGIATQLTGLLLGVARHSAVPCFCALSLLGAFATNGVPADLAGTATGDEQEANFLANARAFLRVQQLGDGSFGTIQPRLQTALATLALLSIQAPPCEEDRVRIERAASYLEKMGSLSGDLGDDVFRTESHALATTALLCSLEHVREPDLRARVAQKVYRAIRLTQQMQDRSSSSPGRGGWKMEGSKGTLNDRRASAWALLAYLAARSYGIPIERANVERGVQFMMGAFKEQTPEADQIGGFSVDAEGLAAVSISSMGGWVLARFGGSEKHRRLNLAWLARHPVEWTGPNYFYANFFRVRALRWSAPGEEFPRTMRRILSHIRDHQQSNGSVGFPPGEAQNMVMMGPVFSTALSILIVNVKHSRLPFDEDYRLEPRF